MEGAPGASGDKHPIISLHSAELIKYHDERKALLSTLLGGENLEGVIRWFDDEAIHIVAPDRTEVKLFKHALAHYRTK